MKTRVAVIYGGRSGEHEISIRSAKSIMAGLDAGRYVVILPPMSQTEREALEGFKNASKANPRDRLFS